MKENIKFILYICFITIALKILSLLIGFKTVTLFSLGLIFYQLEHDKRK